MHVAVVGGGIFGQVIAWRLALRRHWVHVVEPLGPGNARSASGDRSRIVRAFYDEPWFAESGRASLRLWNEWSRDLGARFVEAIGVLYIDREDDSADSRWWRGWIDKGIANLRALGETTIELGPREVRERYPGIDASDVCRAVLEPAGGFGRPALAARTIARAALATGRIEVTTGVVSSIASTGDKATGVMVGERTIEADAIVIAAGFAGVSLLEPFGVKLPIRRIPHWTSYWDVPFPGGTDLMVGNLPAFADLGQKIYGFPDDGESGFKVAWHEPRLEGHSDRTSDEAPTAEQLEALRAVAARRFPALAGATCRATFNCAYDATPDERFLIGPVPGVKSLYFAGGFAGHGFKHAPAIGESIAAEIEGGTPLLDLARYRLHGP